MTTPPSPQNFKPVPQFPLKQIRQKIGEGKEREAIHGNANQNFHNRNAIIDTQKRVQQVEKTVNDAIKQLREDLSKTLLPSMTKEAQDLLLKDDRFIGLLTQAVMNLMHQKMEEHQRRIELLEKEVKELRSKL